MHPLTHSLTATRARKGRNENPVSDSRMDSATEQNGVFEAIPWEATEEAYALLQGGSSGRAPGLG